MKWIIVVLIFFGCEGKRIEVLNGIEWYHSFDEALKVAKEEKKIMMVDFYAGWCVWCKKLDHTTFKDQKVVELLKDFVSVRIDCTKDKDTPRRYGIKGLPTILFIDPNGNVLKRIIGYKGPQDFIKELEEVMRINISSEAVPQLTYPELASHQYG